MIFYFSGTGNTKWVAQQIASAIEEELVYIPDAIRAGRYEYTLAEGERIGFCFPTHGWQPPRIVREFVGNLKIRGRRKEERGRTFEEGERTFEERERRNELQSEGVFCWALTTCGDSTGETMTILNRDLAAKGLRAETQFSVIMPESYVCLPFMYTDTPEREQEKIENARRQMHHIISIIKDCRRGVEELDKGATPRLYSYVIGAYFNRKMVTDKKFMVDDDVCTKCGKCTRVCPVNNIEGKPPVWNHNGQCTACLACYHHCPVHAINYGERTRKRGQYYFK